ncbi:response regulator [Kumtagia ephedrae]|jgi:two-component system nitrate/nitrite response regulator NarL|uniref:DNA-binding response regulator n=1 Tax=Kumtagia ephedrae TaxID=2116701 RepID=A0A2P7S131_9HYPH|nr:response regulator transcription factor [Mesorhizobium ephedrae]PSJ56143.1 DNA-binding response regulator [Mesorhizobium ephedrae]
MTDAISIAVIDDHPLFREGVVRSLAEIERFKFVAEGASRDDAIRIAAETLPDIMLLDLSMPGGGLAAITEILGANPRLRIVVLTVSESSEDVATALNSGAKGYVLKGVGSRSLAEVLTAVAAGETYVSPSLSAKLLSSLSKAGSPIATDPVRTLSKRELEVLSLVACGLSNKEAALRLDRHEKTIKHHMSRILAKLQVGNRTEAALMYRASTNSDAYLDNRMRR